MSSALPPTPFVAIDRNKLAANIQAMQERARNAGVVLRRIGSEWRVEAEPYFLLMNR